MRASIPLRRTPRGLSIVSMLMSVLILAFLVTSVPKKFWKELNPKEQAKEVKRVTKMARDNVWNLLGTEVRNAVTTFEITNSRKPKNLQELARMGLDVSKRCPWGGRLYLKNGYLRSTGNKKAKIRVF